MGSTNTIVVFALISVLLYGTIGSYLLRSQFIGISNFYDAVYYTVVVFSTLGDNVIGPVTLHAKFFVITMVIFGFGSFAMFVSIIFYQVMNHIQKVVSKIEGGKIHMKDHIILCGYGVITELLINKLVRDHRSFILLDNTEHPELISSGRSDFIYFSVPSRIAV